MKDKPHMKDKAVVKPWNRIVLPVVGGVVAAVFIVLALLSRTA